MMKIDDMEKQTCDCGHDILEHDIDEYGKPMACMHQYDLNDKTVSSCEADSKGNCLCKEFVQRGNP